MSVVTTTTGVPGPERTSTARRAGVRGGSACGAPAPFRAHRPSHLRLTRRGRIVLVWIPVTAAVAALLLATGASVARAGTPEAHRSVVVQAGDTLWGIASAADPSADPRDEIAAIARLNGLHGPALRPGQRLLLP